MGGGMGGGGGFFNVPNRGFLPFNPANIPQGGFRPFAVEDDLKIGPQTATTKQAPAVTKAAKLKPATKVAAPKPAAPQQAAAKPSGKRGAVQAIEMDVPAGANAEQVWNDHFAKNKPDPARVRETARQLMKQRNFAGVKGMIGGALRNGQAQPWMYEALALAMQASGSSKDDIERALTSALDFSNRPIDVMHVALYMAKIGLEARALDLFEQASKMAPGAPEPYAHGLNLAKRLNDLDGLKWSLCGILSQAWPEEDMEIYKQAYHTANATLATLKAEGRVDEADKFAKALDAAVARDIVVEAHWDGDADIDLMVEEPSGTICSLHNPRTTGGGALLKDSFPTMDGKSSGGFEEIYACPQGFSGKYRVLVRRMWGKPTAGKVTIDVYLHTRTDQFEHIRQQVPINDGDALVKFDLKDGRRTESLAAQQVATAATQQLSLRRQLINQQLNSMANNYALTDLKQSRGEIPMAPGGLPVIRQPAVGFQPVITVLPEGANLFARAVISADRRYVRFSGLPLFSSVSEVNTFNFATGQSGTSNTPGGGTGGSGIGSGGGGIGGGIGT